MEGNININWEMIHCSLFHIVAQKIKNSYVTPESPMSEDSSKLKRWRFIFCLGLKRAIGIEIFLGWSFLWIWGHLHTLYSWERPHHTPFTPTHLQNFKKACYYPPCDVIGSFLFILFRKWDNFGMVLPWKTPSCSWAHT